MIEEKKFPIYLLQLKWTEGEEGNRTDNSTSMDLMCKEDLSEEEMGVKLDDYKKAISEKEGRLNPRFSVASIKLNERETWCLQWFNHYTFDFGQSDEEVLQSFEDFVSRKHSIIRKNELAGKLVTGTLMGAEDRWRWAGEKLMDGDPRGEGNLPAPCRCVHCKKQGLIRINH